MSDPQEYARFCRFNRLFLVDGLEAWRSALAARGLGPREIEEKIAAAAEFVRRMGEAS